MTIADIEAQLDQPIGRTEAAAEALRTELARAKAEATSQPDERLAKHIWCLTTTLAIQTNYIRAFNKMKQGAFYDAWCVLEQVELNTGWLQKHFPFDRFRLAQIRAATARFQSLFPYRVFMSPEIVQTEKRCSVCGRIVTPRNSCGHIVGEIYMGEMCHRIVAKAKFIGIATVSTPVQKYSVPFLRGGDHYNYAVIKYLIDRLSSPFDGWGVEWTTRRHPHERYADISPSSPCPCKQSNAPYEECCLPTEGVLRPHCVFLFENPPPAETLVIQYA